MSEFTLEYDITLKRTFSSVDRDDDLPIIGD